MLPLPVCRAIHFHQKKLYADENRILMFYIREYPGTEACVPMHDYDFPVKNMQLIKREKEKEDFFAWQLVLGKLKNISG
jgi:hypothetical protein